MSKGNSEPETEQIVAVNQEVRWLVYYRLQQLQIQCHCSSYKPLTIQLHSPLAAIQLWSVVKQTQGNRQELISWLKCCWQKDYIH